MPTQDTSITSNVPGTRGQMKQLGSMFEESMDGQGFTHAQLKFAQDSGKGFQRAARKWLRGYVRQQKPADGRLLVVTDFDSEYEWNERVAAGQYDGVYIDSSFDPKVNLPVGSFTGVLESEVLLNQRRGYTTTQGWIDHIGVLKPEQDLIHPFTLLQIGEDEPERQRKQWMLTIWKDATGRFWYAILSEVSGSRSLYVDPVVPGVEFDARYLGASSVRKLPSAA